MSKAFTSFSLLPKELRLTIWELSLTPQIISFRCHISNFSPQHPPAFLYLLGGDPPYTHFTPNDQERPNEPYFTAFSYPSEDCSPAALSTCQESRLVALSKGYIPWRVRNKEGKIRDLMWNPSCDVIYFPTHDSRQLVPGELQLFGKQFPDQTQEIRHLAVQPSELGPIAPRDVRALPAFISLEELIVVMEDQRQRGYIPYFSTGEDSDRWLVTSHIPRGIVDSLRASQGIFTTISETGEKIAFGNWSATEIRVVADEEDILRWDSCVFQTLCFPGIDLGKIKPIAILN